MLEAIAQELSALQARAAALVAQRQRAQARLWDVVRSQLAHLGVELTAAERDCRTELDLLDPRRPEQRAQALAWIATFDRKVMTSITATHNLLRERRASDARDLQRLHASLHELTVLSGKVESAAVRAMTDELNAAPAGTLPPEWQARAEQWRRAIDAAFARATVRLEDAGRRTWPSSEGALMRFREALSDGDARALPVVSRPVARPLPRKHAKVPGFVLNRFYKKGSLVARPDGIMFAFTNPLAFSIIIGGDPLIVDGKRVDKSRLHMTLGEQRVRSDVVDAKNYLKFPKGALLEVFAEGLQLPPGRHKMQMTVELRKLGWVTLHVDDELR